VILPGAAWHDRKCCTGADYSSGKCTRAAGKGLNPGTCL